ncbi:MAG: succinylglutamate desuccinylase/aspartoacylase family protein [Granulosicoccus sp.]
MRAAFEIGGAAIKPGTRSVVDLELPKLSSQALMSLPVHVIHGRKEGPVVFISAAIHGDELNGVEIIRRVLSTKLLNRISGTVLAIPVVNAYGLAQQSRYLPDRRDLNRSFPGSESGSLASRLAHLFMEQIVSRCSVGIDFHTGSGHRTNLPQIRADLTDEKTLLMARSFGVPVILNSSLRDGSLRASACELGTRVLLYEAGEALRFNELAIRAGVSGVFSVLRSLQMLRPSARQTENHREPYVALNSRWERAPESGILRTRATMGTSVARNDVLGYIHDPATNDQVPITARSAGIIIGRLELPVVHEGDAVYHIARFEDDIADVEENVDNFQLNHGEDALLD